MIYKYNEKKTEMLQCFTKKQPKWNEGNKPIIIIDIKGYSLDFKKRVTMSSLKNIQLVNPNEGKSFYIIRR